MCLNYSPVCVLSFAVELFLPSQVHPFVWFVSFYFSFLLVFFFVVSIAIQHLKCSVFLLIFGKFVLLFDLIIWMKVCLVFIENFWYYDILSIVMLFMCDCIFFWIFDWKAEFAFETLLLSFWRTFPDHLNVNRPWNAFCLEESSLRHLFVLCFLFVITFRFLIFIWILSWIIELKKTRLVLLSYCSPQTLYAIIWMSNIAFFFNVSLVGRVPFDLRILVSMIIFHCCSFGVFRYSSFFCPPVFLLNFFFLFEKLINLWKKKFVSV